MTMLLYSLLVTALVLPLGVKPQGSGSGSGLPIPPLASISDLTQLQRDNLVTMSFTGITREQFDETAIETFKEATANAINSYFNNQVAKRQAMVSPSDVTVVEAMMMNGRLYVVFVVGGEGGQGTPINSAEMVIILQVEGQTIADALGQLLGSTVRVGDVMGVTPPDSSSPEQLSLTTIIGIAVGGVLAVLLLAVVIIIVVVYKCIRKRCKAKDQNSTADYVEVPAEDENSFSSKWQPMKVNTRADYEVVPTSFNKENPDTNTNTSL